MIKSYKDLMVWQKSIRLVREIYLVTAQLPKEEIYGLSSQMRRAAISMPSNIAEGQQRRGTKEFIQFLKIAYGSGAELETQLVILKDLYTKVDISKAEFLLDEIQKMLNSLINKLTH